jgi:hypothetical protein
MFLGARMIRDSAAPSTMLRMVPLPRCAGADKRSRPRGTFDGPEFLLTTTPRKIASLDQRGKRSAERRMPIMSALRKQVYAVCATRLHVRLRSLCGRRARLSALTLAALAIGYHPDGSAPEPGFPKARRSGVLPVRRLRLALSTLRADRSFCRSTGDPEPPGSGAHNLRARAPRLAPSFGSALAKGALSEQGDVLYRKW